MTRLLHAIAGMFVGLALLGLAESCAAKQGGQYTPLKPGALRAP